MPIYEYKCQQCGAQVEKRQNVSDAPLTTCEKCHGKLEKQWSLSGFQFKGAGWYVTDLRRKGHGQLRKNILCRINHIPRHGIQIHRHRSGGKGDHDKKRLMNPRRAILPLLTLLLATSFSAQSRHSAKGDGATEGTVLSVIASREDKKTDPIKLDNLNLYENGVEQKINNFVVDPSPSRIVILVDNSQTLQTSVDKMKEAAMQFAYEIYDGDQIFTLAYDQKPEIVQEWTDDPKKMEASFTTFRKKGNPYLFDSIDLAIDQVIQPLMPGTRKTALVIISDGLDRGSKMTFDKVLNELLARDIVVYSLQIPDRTLGAYRRDQPKAKEVVEELAEKTGGKVFDFSDPQTAAKTICDELRKNRYLLSYQPLDASSYDARRLLLVATNGINVRIKAAQPPNVKVN